MKSPLPYYGSKGNVADEIVGVLPDHIHYVEPYAGSLSVLFAKRRARMETVNDLDRRLMTFWQVLRDRSDELIEKCRLTPHSRTDFDNSLAITDDPLETARRVWVRLTQGRMGVLGKTGWRVRRDPEQSPVPGDLAAYRLRLTAAVDRMLDVSLECRPALEVISDYGKYDDVLLYVDPPYLGTVRNGTRYLHEMPSEQQHMDLANAISATRSAVVLSGYDSPLYQELYAGWHRHEIRTATAQGGTYGARTEVLWSNRPLASQLNLFGIG